MAPYTDDLRIRGFEPLVTPAELIRDLPCTPSMSETVSSARTAIHEILRGRDDRVVVVIGPCSIHDPAAAMDYASRLRPLRDTLGAWLEIVMRVYFEKPRTTVGWKGLINDPNLDNSFDINRGLRTARELLLDITSMGLPAGTEYLDMITPQYIADLIAWGAIGARTTESQVHRELASGLSCPVGFKNGTDGSIRIALDAIKAASQPHHFLSVTKGGHSAIVSTTGNEDCHIILRGGKTPNYDRASVEAACREAGNAALACRLMIDCSHGNSQKNPDNQLIVTQDVVDQLSEGEARIVGVMLESNLVAGREDLVIGKPLTYGRSITDACLSWEATEQALEMLAEGVAERRVALAGTA